MMYTHCPHGYDGPDCERCAGRAEERAIVADLDALIETTGYLGSDYYRRLALVSYRGRLLRGEHVKKGA